MIVRRERPTDVDAVQVLTRAAFGRDMEAELLADLRTDPGWLAQMSLVAEEDGTVVGHVVCSRATVDGRPAVGLGPISVAPARQHAGIGSALVHAVIAVAEAAGEPLVVLLGDPAYYARFGFVTATDVGVTPPEPAWGRYFQARPLVADHPTGAFVYAPPFDRAS